MNQKLISNVLANIVQMFVSALLIFVLYRFISFKLGVGLLGVWSVVLASASTSKLADFGLTAGLTRFVARELARNDLYRAAKVVETTSVTIIIVSIIVLFSVYPVLIYFLKKIFIGKYLLEALGVLPLALISLWLSALSMVVQSALDGCQKMVSRAVIVTFGQFVMLFLSFLFVPKYGLEGLAYAQCMQSLFLSIVGWITLRFTLFNLSILPIQWDRLIFREMIAYCLTLQLGTALMLFFDPLTKCFMAKFGGPVSAGYFEIANQVVIRIRAVVVAANQAVVPVVTQLLESNNELLLKKFYLKNFRMLFVIVVTVFSIVFTTSNIIDLVVIGKDQPQFMFFLKISLIAWMINTISVPAYFMNMGTGYVYINTLSSIIMGTINFVLGVFLGTLYGAYGVMLAYFIALVFGSVYLLIAFQLKHDISLKLLMFREHLILISVSLFVLAFGLLRDHYFIDRQYDIPIILILCLNIIIAFWLHPVRLILVDRLKGVLIK